MNKNLVVAFILSVLLNFVVGAKCSQFEGRIINGIIANEARSFAVRIISVVSATSPFGYVSSGVAVTSNHVVTVGQAVHGFGMWYIGHGSIHVDEQTESISTDATVHPDYNSTFLHNNIAVIRITNAIATPIAIVPSELFSLVFGYGFIDELNTLSRSLKQTPLIILPDRSTCIPPFNEAVLTSNNLCSTFTVTDTRITNGDQGGPVTNTESTGVSAIISFWGVDHNLVGLVNLSEYNDFIEQQLVL